MSMSELYRAAKKIKSNSYMDYTRNPHRERNLRQGIWEGKARDRDDEGRGCLTQRTVSKNTNDSCQEEQNKVWVQINGVYNCE